MQESIIVLILQTYGILPAVSLSMALLIRVFGIMSGLLGGLTSLSLSPNDSSLRAN
jgi:hypothetical protein